MEGSTRLIKDPGAARVFGHAAMEDPRMNMHYDENAVKNNEGERWQVEKVAQERRPSLGRLRTPCALRIHCNTVRSEISDPSIFNSP